MERHLTKGSTNKESNKGLREALKPAKIPSASATKATPASLPSTPNPPPTTIEEATKALEEATHRAGWFAKQGTKAIVTEGYMADFTYAKAGASIATVAATAAYSITDIKYGSLLFSTFIHEADSAVLAAEAAYAVLAANSGTTTWIMWALWSLLTLIPRLILWLFWPLDFDVSPVILNMTLQSIIASGATSAAAAQSAIEAAAATDKVTTFTATDDHTHYDANDLSRLYDASRLALASASVASVAARATRTLRPMMSIRAAHAACNAMAASRDATIMRLKIMVAMAQMPGLELGAIENKDMQAWITDFDVLKASQSGLEKDDLPAHERFDYYHVAMAEIFSAKKIKDGLHNGTITVDTGSGRASDADMSGDSGLDDASTVSASTVRASTPEQVDEAMDYVRIGS
ncbi:hypothetical protein F503_07656 [Ophiostoma piceae UAMH 11346]|uniref:Uncharacterized protein n=1 Tax=Ophiostoma piceae (strain UAMH 11346) TaxID=1262450 RepID=S3CAT8_OPHP1|nr:hypothetical protein F503_07656 [Ophiostoma piceae UAMH 11346]